MKVNGYHHIGLDVVDAEKSLQFYTEGLGGKEIFRFPMGDSGKNIYLVDLGNNAVVEIIPNGNGQEGANARWAHVALSCDDIQAGYDLAIKAGATSRSEPKDVMLGDMAARIAFVFGPDGEIIEFFKAL